MASAPWDSAPAEDSLFVLVTGANSGVGLGIGQRLIDDFLGSRPLNAHLVLIVTTRGAKKAQETLAALRQHLQTAAETSKVLKARSGPGAYDPAQAVARVHVVAVQLDLCNLESVFAAAHQLRHGSSSSPRIPRLDAVIFNAGYGGWTGVEWGGLLWHMITRGFVDMMTWPTFKGAEPGLVIDPLRAMRARLPTKAAKAAAPPPVIGEVFCANVFGHYVLAHELLPLLARRAGDKAPRGRIVWQSTVEALEAAFSLEDFEGLRTRAAYESAKRLTDVLVLTDELPGVRPLSDSFYVPTDDDDDDDEPLSPSKQLQPQPQLPEEGRPRNYVIHPGVLATGLFPLPALLFPFYQLGILLARLLGSPWHPRNTYESAASAVHVAVRTQAELDAEHAHKQKIGSGSLRWTGNGVPKKTEVEGWGWEGRVEDAVALARDPAVGELRKIIGRRPGVVDLTREAREDFEVLGAACWREMERLRGEWTARYLELAKEAEPGLD